MRVLQPQEGAEGGAQAGEAPTIDLDAEVFSKLTPEDVRAVVESVAAEMLGGLQVWKLFCFSESKRVTILSLIIFIVHILTVYLS